MKKKNLWLFFNIYCATFGIPQFKKIFLDTHFSHITPSRSTTTTLEIPERQKITNVFRISTQTKHSIRNSPRFFFQPSSCKKVEKNDTLLTFHKWK